jgi:hypothetical protein
MDSPSSTLAPVGTLCAQCGYAVEGIDLSRPCPECAFPVAGSLKPTQLDLLPPSRVTAFMWGAGIWALYSVGSVFAQLCTTISDVGGGITAWPTGGEPWYRSLGRAMAYSVWYVTPTQFVASLLLTPSVRPGPASGLNSRLLMLLLLNTAGWVATSGFYFQYFQNASATTPSNYPSNALQITGGVVMCVTAALSLTWMTQIGRRARWKAAHWLGPVAAVSMPLGWACVYAHYFENSGPRPTSPSGVTTALSYAGLALLLPSLVFSLILWRKLRVIVKRLDTAHQ